MGHSKRLEIGLKQYMCVFIYSESVFMERNKVWHFKSKQMVFLVMLGQLTQDAVMIQAMGILFFLEKYIQTGYRML
jgi:hypothetical protein